MNGVNLLLTALRVCREQDNSDAVFDIENEDPKSRVMHVTTLVAALFMAVSTVCAHIITALLFFHPFQEMATRIVARIALTAVAVPDGAYFWLGRRL